MDTKVREFLSAHVDAWETVVEHYPYSLPMSAESFVGDVSALRRAVTESGSHFFDRDAMRFFNSYVSKGRVIGGRFFITSEKMDGPERERQYSVRWVYRAPTTEMLQIDRFTDRFDSLQAARDFAYHAHEVLPFPAVGEAEVTLIDPDNPDPEDTLGQALKALRDEQN